MVPGLPRLRQIGQQQAQRVRRPYLRVAVGAHDPKQARSLCAGEGGAHQRGQQVEGVRARPLQIVEHQQRACRPGHVRQQARHGCEQQSPFLLRRERTGG
jgi:hypothetical protein